jgi:hypothetical protein
VLRDSGLGSSRFVNPRGQVIGADGAVGEFLGRLLERAWALRLPDLFTCACPGAVWQRLDRHGVSVVALPTEALTEDELETVRRFVLAHLVAAGFADLDALYEARVEALPRSSIRPGELHLLAGSPDDGEILCYTAVRGLGPQAGVSLRSRARPPLPVERTHGAGIFDRVPLLAEMPADRVRDTGRTVKNQLLGPLDGVSVRAPVEICLALVQMFAGPLGGEVDALVGEVEDNVLKRQLDFFHLPTLTLRGTIPYEDTPYFARYAEHVFHPYAALTSDLRAHSVARADVIEEALERPGSAGIAALLDLKRSSASPRSTLEPREGLPPLTSVDAGQERHGPAARRRLCAEGELLRGVRPFQRLTTAEARVLRSFMTPRAVGAGERLLPQDDGGAFYLIVSGEAEVLLPDAGCAVVRQLGPGSCFGDPEKIVATTPVRLLVLAAEDYRRYVAPLDEWTSNDLAHR